jgi:phage major head subunit gpT-like protein
MQISQAALASIYRGYRVIYDQAYQASPTISDAFVMESPSSNEQEVIDWLGAVPGMKKLVGEIVIQNLAAGTWTVTNDEFSDVVAVKQSRIENDTFGIYNPLMAAMGAAAKQHKDELVISNVLVNGFSQKDFTGKNFFDTAKKREPKDAGYTNYAEYPLNAFGYMKGRANLLGRLNAAGRPLNLGRKLELVCSTANEPIAKQILSSDTMIQAIAGTAGGTSVGGSITNINKGTATVVPSAYIDASETPNAWFLLETGMIFKPLIWQVNKAAVLTSITNPESDHVFKHHEFLYQAYGRYNASYLFGDFAFGSDGTGDALTTYP